MQKRVYIYRILSIVLFAAGVMLLARSGAGIAGAAVGAPAAWGISLSFILGMAFMIAAVVMFAVAALPAAGTLENILRRELINRGGNPDEKPIIFLDANYLFNKFKHPQSRKGYVENLQHKGYNVKIPKALREEMWELRDIRGETNPSGYAENLLEETKEAMKQTEKYQKGLEILGYSNKEDVPRQLWHYFRKEKENVFDSVASGQMSPDEAWPHLRNKIERHYTRIDRDSDILASAVATAEDPNNQLKVVLVSSDRHMSEAVDILMQKHPVLRSKLIYIIPEDLKNTP
ncbi:MAG TPA: hypothetical protein VJA86_01755 [Candidatus Nanoarchaeia archaeon]|nr:hypothetical protein [Candidatus Nanoarchaeia archaeon]